MKLDIYLNKASNLWAENRLLKFFMICLLISQVVMGVTVISASRNARTIIIPPGLNEKVEFVAYRASTEYVREIARYISSLAFNYTPGRARKQFNELMTMFHNSTYAEAQKMFDNLAFEIEEANITNTFYVTKIQADEVKKKITISGSRKQYTSDTLLYAGRVDYVVRYRIDNGQFSILGIAERELEKALDENVETLSEGKE